MNKITRPNMDMSTGSSLTETKLQGIFVRSLNQYGIALGVRPSAGNPAGAPLPAMPAPGNTEAGKSANRIEQGRKAYERLKASIGAEGTPVLDAYGINTPGFMSNLEEELRSLYTAPWLVVVDEPHQQPVPEWLQDAFRRTVEKVKGGGVTIPGRFQPDAAPPEQESDEWACRRSQRDFYDRLVAKLGWSPTRAAVKSIEVTASLPQYLEPLEFNKLLEAMHDALSAVQKSPEKSARTAAPSWSLGVKELPAAGRFLEGLQLLTAPLDGLHAELIRTEEPRQVDLVVWQPCPLPEEWHKAITAYVEAWKPHFNRPR